MDKQNLFVYLHILIKIAVSMQNLKSIFLEKEIQWKECIFILPYQKNN